MTESIVCIMGPTASGKTDLAIEAVSRWPMDIISVDSALVYRDMNIGTAKPDTALLAKAPHRLIDIVDPVQAYSAANFAADAKREIAEISANERIPLLVGGTMLYYRALLDGLSNLPSADESIRARLDEELKEKGSQALHERLAKIDPPAAERIHPNDPQRLLRALEVYELTGKPLSQLQSEQKKTGWQGRVLKLILAPESREVLRERIAQRFEIMLANGFVDEVQRLMDRGDLDLDKPSMRSVGYRQVWQYLTGELSHEQMIEQGVTATRQLAKRQMTWLRKEQGAIWVDPLKEGVSEMVAEHINRFITSKV